MANIMGTIIDLGKFLENSSADVMVTYGGERTAFSLCENRIYCIPDYQREIRWTKDHLMELVSDIYHGDKFLGNIILNKITDSEYEIIDGQQRITVLLMLIYYINHMHSAKIGTFVPCQIKMVNFDQFDLLKDHNFDISKANGQVVTVIEASDIFKQRFRYIELWQILQQIDYLNGRANCSQFMTNLRRSQINLIINTGDTDSYGIGYFLDVNLKGVKLDTEDIFKAYLFRFDNERPIRDEWNTFKINSFNLNALISYPTMSLLSHYLNCCLSNDIDYRSIQFKEDFTILNNLDIAGERHYSGEHIIKAIQDKQYMLGVMRGINKFLELALDVLSTTTPSIDFCNLFNVASNIDRIEKEIIHNFIRRVLKDQTVVPKLLIMKYIIEVLFDNKGKTKLDYHKIYGMYMLSVVFTIFEGEKDINKIISVVRSADWHNQAIQKTKSYFEGKEIAKTRITAQYKLTDFIDDDQYQHRCKSLATIYNYFRINNGTVLISNKQQLHDYINRPDQYTLEHFLVNKKATYTLGSNAERKQFSCPTPIKKYANSIFNFIFLDRDTNNISLGECSLPEKIVILNSLLAENPELLKCKYSAMIVEKSKDHFNNLISLPYADADNDQPAIDNYYADSFPELFIDFARDVIKAVSDQIKKSIS